MMRLARFLAALKASKSCALLEERHARLAALRDLTATLMLLLNHGTHLRLIHVLVRTGA